MHTKESLQQQFHSLRAAKNHYGITKCHSWWDLADRLNAEQPSPMTINVVINSSGVKLIDTLENLVPAIPVKQADKNHKSTLPLPLVHSDLDDYGLDPYEFRVYAHIVRRTGGKLNGKCFAKQKTIAVSCCMSVRKVQYALRTLCEAGLITKEERRGYSDVYCLTPKDNWKSREDIKQIRQAVKLNH